MRRPPTVTRITRYTLLSVRPSVPCSPLSRTENYTIFKLTGEVTYIRNSLTGRAILREGHISCRHGARYLV